MERRFGRAIILGFMCGIAGFLGSFAPESLRAMNETIAHRGPDDAGYHFDENVGLGFAHRRLSIIDLSSAGHQPMWDAERRVVIIFNGEIYNYRELARELRADGYRFNSSSDTEVILNLYRRDGVDCARKLIGIFALALWDVERRTLFLARDGMGVKPLYFAETRQGVAFASEIKALCRLPEVDRTLDYVALAQYMTYLYCPAPRTPIRAIRKLLPGEAMLVTRDGVKKRWLFYRQPYDQPQSKLSVADAEQATADQLAHAVKRQMVADVPVGAFLSGGLDSSAIVTFARKFARRGEVPCFTIGFSEGSPYREGVVEDLPYANRVAKHLGVKLSTIWVGSEMSGGLEKMIWHLDEPQADPAALNVYYICQLARQQGIKVMLSGAGGDDIFSGYRRHQALQQERWWSWLPRPARTALRAFSDLPAKNTPFGRRVAKAFQHADESPERRLAGYFAWLRHEQVLGLFHPDLRRELESADPFEPLLAALHELPPDTPALNQMLFLDSKFFLTDHNLNYTDKMSMAAGVEVRVPFLDPDLMAFAARLPVKYKQRGATGKWILKRAMEIHLPHDAIYRPKTGFGVPLRAWMQHELRGMVDDTLSEATLRARGLFDPAGVRKLLQQDRLGRLDASYPIFELICIETWLKLFQDRPASASVTGRAV